MNELKQLQDIQGEIREGYAPEKAALYYGEPWKFNESFGGATDRHSTVVLWDDSISGIPATKRSIVCVNACAGMDDPEKEVSFLRRLRWTLITDRMPTVDDANEYHDVEWSDGTDRWDNQFYTPNMGNRKATHWRRIVLP